MLKELLRTRSGVKRIVFVRHGRDMGADVRELSEFGKRQASRTAEFLKNVAFDGLYSSDLLRTQQTFGYITKFHSLEKKLNRGLREIRPFYIMGEVELAEEHGQPLKSFLKELNSSDQELVLAVSHCHLIRYVLSLKALNSPSSDTRTVKDMFDEGQIDRNGCSVDMANCSITIVDINEAGEITPLAINYIKHLKGLRVEN